MAQEESANRNAVAHHKSGLYKITLAAVMTAATCVIAPLAIPVGPVPISLTNFAIYLSVYLLGWKTGTISYVVYLLIGMAGMPVFSGFTGGLSRLVGPTGGYLIGFVATAVLAGIVIDKFQNRAVHMIGMILGTMLAYAFETAWYCLLTDSELWAALWVCVLPFILGDLVKMTAAVTMGPKIRRRLEKAGLCDRE